MDLSKNLVSPRGDTSPPPHQNVSSPLTGMCGGGSSGSLGGITVTLLSVFCLVSFVWVFGEELEELLKLVTVSPELHGTEDIFKVLYRILIYVIK